MKTKRTARIATRSPFAYMEITMEDKTLLTYYQAIERASEDMLQAARDGDWDQVIKLEGACAVLISQLKHAAAQRELAPEEARMKSKIMQRILLNDAQIRNLAEPWLDDLDCLLTGKTKAVH